MHASDKSILRQASNKILRLAQNTLVTRVLFSVHPLGVQNPSISTKNIAKDTNVKKRTVQRVLKRYMESGATIGVVGSERKKGFVNKIVAKK